MLKPHPVLHGVLFHSYRNDRKLHEHGTIELTSGFSGKGFHLPGNAKRVNRRKYIQNLCWVLVYFDHSHIQSWVERYTVLIYIISDSSKLGIPFNSGEGQKNNNWKNGEAWWGSYSAWWEWIADEIGSSGYRKYGLI